MPGREHSDWYPLALIVVTALVMFALGSAIAVWLVATPVPVIAEPKASLPNIARARGDHETSGTTASPLGPAPASPQQIAPGPTLSAATASGAPPSPTAKPSTSPSAAAAAATSSATNPPGPQGGNFSLQLGAFLDETKAKSLAAQVATQGYAPLSVVAADGYGRTWHYVRLGAFADERAAAVAASDLFVRAGIGAAVVRVSAANAGG